MPWNVFVTRGKSESIFKTINKQIPFRLRLAWTAGTILEFAFIGGVVCVIWHFVSKYW